MSGGGAHGFVAIAPGIDQHGKVACHFLHQLGIAELALEPLERGVGPQRAADHEALDDRAGGMGEAVGQVLQRLVQAQDHGAAAIGVAFGQQGLELAPARRLHRRQLPPLGLDAQVVEALDRAQHRVIRAALGRQRLRGNDLEQQFVARLARRLPELEHLLLLLQP